MQDENEFTFIYKVPMEKKSLVASCVLKNHCIFQFPIIFRKSEVQQVQTPMTERKRKSTAGFMNSALRDVDGVLS